MIIPTLYRIVDTWLGGMRLERFVDRPTFSDWEAVSAADRPVGGFYMVSLEDYQRLTSRVDKAERRAAAQRKSRLERAGKGEA